MPKKHLTSCFFFLRKKSTRWVKNSLRGWWHSMYVKIPVELLQLVCSRISMLGKTKLTSEESVESRKCKDADRPIISYTANSVSNSRKLLSLLYREEN